MTHHCKAWSRELPLETVCRVDEVLKSSCTAPRSVTKAGNGGNMPKLQLCNSRQQGAIPYPCPDIGTFG